MNSSLVPNGVLIISLSTLQRFPKKIITIIIYQHFIYATHFFYKIPACLYNSVVFHTLLFQAARKSYLLISASIN